MAEPEEYVDLTAKRDRGVLKRVIEPAPPESLTPCEGRRPICVVWYIGRLKETGEVFESSEDGGFPITVEIGAKKMILGWEIALKTMSVGEVCEVIIQPEYAYGSKGSPPDIPSDAALIFEMHLKEVKPKRMDVAAQSTASQQRAVEEKERLAALRADRGSAAATRDEEKRKREEAKKTAAARMAERLSSKGAKGKGHGKHSKK